MRDASKFPILQVRSETMRNMLSNIAECVRLKQKVRLDEDLLGKYPGKLRAQVVASGAHLRA